MAVYSELLIDGFLALLLIAAIILFYLVHSRLGAIREGQSELKKLVDSLNDATAQAQNSVVGLNATAEEIEHKLKLESQKATSIMDELSLMTEAGNNLADRIEKGLTRNTEGSGTAAGSGTKENKKQQKEILAALREAR